MKENNNNAAILNYAIKVLAKQKMSENAKQYCVKTILHLSIIYPYLIPLLEQYVFTPYNAEIALIERFSNMVFKSAIINDAYEALIYSIYFAMRYDFKIDGLTASSVIAKENCLFSIVSYLYFHKYNYVTELQDLKNYAKQLSSNDSDFDENWLFIYEVLSESNLVDDWKPMKKANVTFIKSEFWEMTS